MGHHPGMTMPGEGVLNAPMPGWAILLILAVTVLLVYLGWRWFNNLGKPV